MKIVLASNNKGKLAELMPLFAPLGVELIAQSSLGVPEAPELRSTQVFRRLRTMRVCASRLGAVCRAWIRLFTACNLATRRVTITTAALC
jgi:inosine/xanthosine triphosphate pyrophosphatase family protein